MRLYEGLRVVEFTTNIAGPTIGRWLAEYGADVIHVERPAVDTLPCLTVSAPNITP